MCRSKTYLSFSTLSLCNSLFFYPRLVLGPQRFCDSLQGFARRGLDLSVAAVHLVEHLAIEQLGPASSFDQFLFLGCPLALFSLHKHAELPVAAGLAFVEDRRLGQAGNTRDRRLDRCGPEFVRDHRH